ncbi:MAG: hypothetical protein ACK476_03825 [Fluviicola sp.]
MKTYIFIFTLILSSIAKAQLFDTSKLFENIHGLKQDRTTFYEVEGYSISDTYEAINPKDTDFIKFKRKYKIAKDALISESEEYRQAKIITEISPVNSNQETSRIIYVFPVSETEARVISFSTLIKRNFELEKYFLKTLIEGVIPSSSFTSIEIDSISFAGRYIQLGPICNWMSPHNIQCQNMGQMNWSEFQSLDKAIEMTSAQYNMVSSKWMGKMISTDSIDVIFEGSETKILKVNYQLKAPSLITGGTNKLVVFFVSTKVREKYVSCVLSQYVTNYSEFELASLLSEVMTLKN